MKQVNAVIDLLVFGIIYGGAIPNLSPSLNLDRELLQVVGCNKLANFIFFK